MQANLQSNGLWMLAVFVVLVAGAASVGAQYRPGPWYAALAKPSWTPPNWLFPVAWTVLYTMIAVASAASAASRVRHGITKSSAYRTIPKP